MCSAPNTILIGTTSWTEKTLIESGRFYPPSAKGSEERLRYYATQFPIVEVDSSYYGMPSERNSRLWVERTPESFTFDIKAFRLFTHHQTPPNALPADVRRDLGNPTKNVYYRDLPEELTNELWSRFRPALHPLKRAGKLGVVLFQFPPWFYYRPSNLDYLRHCAEQMKEFQIALEFRQKSWLNERHQNKVLEFQRDHNMAHVIVDEPQGFTSSIPTVWEVPCRDVAILRLHGRNRATWEKKGLRSSAERFKYLYTDAELRALVRPIQTLAARAKQMHVLFNNCYRDYGQRNALELQQLLDKGKLYS